MKKGHHEEKDSKQRFWTRFNRKNVQENNPTVKTERMVEVENPEFPYAGEQFLADSLDEEDAIIKDGTGNNNERNLMTQTITQYFDYVNPRPNTRQECMNIMVKPKPMKKLKSATLI